MARLASCPQCNQELLVPGETSGDAWAKCPECRAFFQLNDTVSRELPAALVVETDSLEADAQTAPTVADISSSATWSDASGAEPEPSKAPELDAETLVVEPQSTDDLQAAAQRIDAWFRSAKTLPDVPPITDNETEPGSPDENAESSDATATDETIEIGASSLDDMGTPADMEFEDSLELSQGTATWDDSKHMERLLADIEGPTADELAPAAETSADSEYEGARVQSGDASSAADMPKFVSQVGGTRRRKRSLLRTLVMVAVAGVIGSGLGYYALLWLRGKSADFLDVAQYLPPAMLPAEFQTTPRQLAAAAPLRTPAEVESSDESATPAQPADEPAEEQASFTTPAEPETPPTDDDRYTSDANDVPAPSAEPATLDEPTAAPLTDEVAAVDVATLKDAPSFTADELAAALDAAKTAQPALVAGSLEDGREVQAQRATAIRCSQTCAKGDVCRRFIERRVHGDIAASERRAIPRNALRRTHAWRSRHDSAQVDRFEASQTRRRALRR